MIKLKITPQVRLKIESSIKKCKKRMIHALDDGFEYNRLAVPRSTRFLRKHDSEKMNMFVLFVDIGASTRMSSELSPDALGKIIRLFSQEMAYVIEDHGGYVLKYIGDAVIGYFPADGMPRVVAKKSIYCALTMVTIIERAINPVLQETGYPQLKVKVSIDLGENSIMRYGLDKKKSHIDIIGLAINLGSKMLQGVEKPNHLIIGNQVYLKLPHHLKTCFKKLHTNTRTWSYRDFTSKQPYSIFLTRLYPV
jgi:class 3 adenylate cyclase